MIFCHELRRNQKNKETLAETIPSDIPASQLWLASTRPPWSLIGPPWRHISHSSPQPGILTIAAKISAQCIGINLNTLCTVTLQQYVVFIWPKYEIGIIRNTFVYIHDLCHLWANLRKIQTNLFLAILDKYFVSEGEYIAAWCWMAHKDADEYLIRSSPVSEGSLTSWCTEQSVMMSKVHFRWL